MQRIGFIYLDMSYHIYHSISIACSLARRDGCEVHLICLSRHVNLVRKLLDDLSADRVIVKEVTPHWLMDLPQYLEMKLQLRHSVFFKYRSYLRQFDAFVMTLYNDLDLKKYLPKSNPKFIYSKHGPSNEDYSFDNQIKEFDLFFMSGKHEHQKRAKMGHLDDCNHAIIGYPKLDLVSRSDKDYIFKDRRKVVLYCPHWKKDLSSYFVLGKKILDYFSKQDKYNLIFAPHALLLQRNWMARYTIHPYSLYSHIHIDTGSLRSNDMTYTKTADLFLGDVSSQALEFSLYSHRPCLFIDAHGLKDGDQKFFSWNMGNVIQNVDSLDRELETAFDSFDSTYRQVQEKAMSIMFHNDSRNASDLAANEIVNLLSRENNG